MVLIFLVVQCLDGAMTYLGVTRWGPGIEANPLVSAAVGVAALQLACRCDDRVPHPDEVVLRLDRRVHVQTPVA